MTNLSKITKNKLSLLFLINLSLLTACGSLNKSDAGINIACASVESYLDTKALILSSAKTRNFDPISEVNSLIGNPPTTSADGKSIHENYLKAMSEWAVGFVTAVNSSNSTKGVTDVASKLEKRIDDIAIDCTNHGWVFQEGWRG